MFCLKDKNFVLILNKKLFKYFLRKELNPFIFFLKTLELAKSNLTISLINSIIAGFGISIIAAILGCFVIWRKMAYFGDSLAHSTLLGIAFGILIGISSNITIIGVAIAFAILLTYLQNKNILSTDALLGILAHSSLALGILIISILEKQDHIEHEHNHIDVHSLLVGDISSITMHQNIFIYLVLFTVLILTYFNWSKLLFITIDKDLAKANGINSFKTQLIFMLMMVLVVASAVKIIGVLLPKNLLKIAIFGRC